MAETLVRPNQHETENRTDGDLDEQFDALISANTWGGAVRAYEEMTEPLLEEIAAIDGLGQDEIDEIFEDAYEARIVELKEHLDAMTDVFMKSPYEAVVAEALYLFAICEERADVTVDKNTGVTTTEFVTRDPGRTKADLHFKQRQFSDGRWQINIEVPLRGEGYTGAELPYTITANSDNELKVVQKIYKHYRYDQVELAFDDGEQTSQGRDRLRQYFQDTLVATAMVAERSADEREAADAQAKTFLLKKRIADRSI